MALAVDWFLEMQIFGLLLESNLAASDDRHLLE